MVAATIVVGATMMFATFPSIGIYHHFTPFKKRALAPFIFKVLT